MNRCIFSNRIRVAVLLLVITAVAMIPFAMPGIESGFTDLFFHLWRIESIKDGLKNGIFPVKIYGTILDGSGYASGVFYPDLFLYIPAFFRLMGLSVGLSYKLLILIVTFATAMIAYRVAYYIIDDVKLALVFSFIWTTCNYRLEDVYNRAALGEAIALTFFPLAIGGLFTIIYAQKTDSEYKGMVWLTLGLTGIIQSHILSTEMVGLFMILMVIVNLKQVLVRNKILTIIKSALCFGFLNIWFVLPFFDYMLHEKVVVMKPSLHTIQVQGDKLKNILPFFDTESIMWDGSLSTTQPKTIGYSLLLLLILLIYFWIRDNKDLDQGKNLILILAGLWLSSCYFPYDFLCSKSSFLNSILGTMQFPWRWIGVVSAVIYLAAVYGVREYDIDKISKTLIGIIVVVTIISAMQKNIEIISYHRNSGEISYMGQESDIPNAWYNQIMGGEYVPLKSLKGKAVYEYEEYKCPETVVDYSITGNTCEMTIDNGQGEIITPFLYYSGYKAEDENGREVKVDCSEDGYAQINLNANYSGKVIVEYKEKTIWRIAECISLISAVLFIGYICHREKSKCRKY